MSNLRLTITLGVLLCLFACHRTSQLPSTLLRAEQLMDTAPDSALTYYEDHGTPAQLMEAYWETG